jgi:hypothetical protein
MKKFCCRKDLERSHSTDLGYIFLYPNASSIPSAVLRPIEGIQCE